MTKSYYDRKIKKASLGFLTLILSMLWIYPTYYISSLSFVDQTDPTSLLLLTEILPPFLVFTASQLAPYAMEYLSFLQPHDSLAQVESSTISKLFTFLMLNVHFVFTLLTAAWSASDSIFLNPLSWVELIAVSFPDGASFFINYVRHS